MIATNLRSLLVAAAAALLPACVGLTSGPADALVVDPGSASLHTGESQQFRAVVAGADAAVSWTAEPPGCGSISQAGLYVAPGVAGTCVVRASSATDATRTATATVTVTEPPPPTSASFRASLSPQAGVTGMQRVNFAVPLPAALLADPARIRIASTGGGELAAARRALASWPDGSLRAVQVQVEVDVGAVTALDVEVDAEPMVGTLPLVDVADTLVQADGTAGPRVWVVLPASWLAPSGVAGPLLPASTLTGTPLDAWASICDYATWNVDSFLAVATDRGSWLFDRPTALYRGYAMTGDRDALESGYREAAIYRAGISGTGSSTRIGVPTSADDLKYHYTQGMALHYLLSGDDRFREAAEDVATRAHDLWPDPGYAGGADFWTERHAGFALLAYEWATAVSDDRAATFASWADVAVRAYLLMQDDGAHAWETDARCFAHSADAHGEAYGYFGCSPWMSAILADGLDAHARRVGGSAGDAAATGLVRLGRMVARHGLDPTGKPYYWMGAGVPAAEVDPFDEHWGESAYVVAMAWHWAGRDDAALRAAADDLVAGLGTLGEAGQLRSFNWQCRSAVATPWFLRQ
jgi:hypothetical protein